MSLCRAAGGTWGRERQAGFTLHATLHVLDVGRVDESRSEHQYKSISTGCVTRCVHAQALYEWMR